jgi:hypothetical protein
MDQDSNNAAQNPSGESSLRPAPEWAVAMDKRPAPVVLACLSGLFLYIALSFPSLKASCSMSSAICGVYAIQIAIWRAALMIVGTIQRR